MGAVQLNSQHKTHGSIITTSVRQNVEKEEVVLILSIEMDPNLLLLIMMTIVLYFFTKICLAVITASQQRVYMYRPPRWSTLGTKARFEGRRTLQDKWRNKPLTEGLRIEYVRNLRKITNEIVK